MLCQVYRQPAQCLTGEVVLWAHVCLHICASFSQRSIVVVISLHRTLFHNTSPRPGEDKTVVCTILLFNRCKPAQIKAEIKAWHFNVVSIIIVKLNVLRVYRMRTTELSVYLERGQHAAVTAAFIVLHMNDMLFCLSNETFN